MCMVVVNFLVGFFQLGLGLGVRVGVRVRVSRVLLSCIDGFIEFGEKV